MTVDHWEVSLDDLQLEQSLGEGAFGRVYKAILLNLPKDASAVSKGKSSSVSSSSPCRTEEGHFVAVKMLQGMFQRVNFTIVQVAGDFK